MKPTLALHCALLAIATSPVHAEDFAESISSALSYSAFDDQVRARLSGLLDLELYTFSGDAPGLIFTDDSHLFAPRLSLFLDAQLGAPLYFFSQARVDTGFDPSDDSLGIRLDEYAMRLTPWEDGRLSVQAGCFATIVGTYVERHLSWDNPFINAPLVYENMTAIYDHEAPYDQADFADGLTHEKYEYNPVIWGPSYATGLSVSGKSGTLEYAAEIKNAGLASRPESWNGFDTGFDHSTVSTRIAWRPDMAWKLGLSASQGPYFTEEASSGLPIGTDINDYRQLVLGQDISFAWKHWQIWAEIYQARFEVPLAGDADTLGYYIEAKYKFTPNLFGALRWNQQFFDDVPDGLGGEVPWGRDIHRIDAALTWRFSTSAQAKIQYSLQHESDGGGSSDLVAGQLTFRF